MAECGVREKGSERERKARESTQVHCVQSANWHGRRQSKRAWSGDGGVRGEATGEREEQRGEEERGRTSAALNAAPNWTRNSPMELHRNISNYFGAAKEQRVPGNASW